MKKIFSMRITLNVSNLKTRSSDKPRKLSKLITYDRPVLSKLIRDIRITVWFNVITLTFPFDTLMGFFCCLRFQYTPIVIMMMSRRNTFIMTVFPNLRRGGSFRRCFFPGSICSILSFSLQSWVLNSSEIQGNDRHNCITCTYVKRCYVHTSEYLQRKMPGWTRTKQCCRSRREFWAERGSCSSNICHWRALCWSTWSSRTFK